MSDRKRWYIDDILISSCFSEVLGTPLSSLTFHWWLASYPFEKLEAMRLPHVCNTNISTSQHLSHTFFFPFCCYRCKVPFSIKDQALHMWSTKSVSQPLPLSQGLSSCKYPLSFLNYQCPFPLDHLHQFIKHNCKKKNNLINKFLSSSPPCLLPHISSPLQRKLYLKCCLLFSPISFLTSFNLNLIESVLPRH